MVLKTLLFDSYVSVLKCKNLMCIPIHFIVESKLTSSASPMVVFYSNFNEAILPSEIFLLLTQCLKQVIQMKIDLRVVSGLKARNAYFILHLKMKMTECYRRVEGELYSMYIRICDLSLLKFLFNIRAKLKQKSSFNSNIKSDINTNVKAFFQL